MAASPDGPAKSVDRVEAGPVDERDEQLGTSMVQQFLRGRSDNGPSTNFRTRPRDSTRVERPAIRLIRPSNASCQQAGLRCDLRPPHDRLPSHTDDQRWLHPSPHRVRSRSVCLPSCVSEGLCNVAKSGGSSSTSGGWSDCCQDDDASGFQVMQVVAPAGFDISGLGIEVTAGAGEGLPLEGVLRLAFPRPGFTPCTWLTTVSRDDLIERAAVLSSRKLSEIDDALRLAEQVQERSATTEKLSEIRDALRRGELGRRRRSRRPRRHGRSRRDDPRWTPAAPTPLTIEITIYGWSIRAPPRHGTRSGMPAHAAAVW
ncbi:hypothetical protein STANM309S_03072 [Streptomyces tanashiensis]